MYNLFKTQLLRSEINYLYHILTQDKTMEERNYGATCAYTFCLSYMDFEPPTEEVIRLQAERDKLYEKVKDVETN